MAERDILVILVEDDFFARDSMASRLQRDSAVRVLGEYGAPAEALAALADSRPPRPSLLMIDLDFPANPGAGLALAEEARAAAPGLRLLCTTLDLDAVMLGRLLAIPVDGVALKNELGDALGSAIAHCAAGEFVVTPGVQAFATHLEVGRPCHVVPPVTLPREMADYLQRVAYLRYVRGLSTDQIVEDLTLSPATVESYLKEIKSILGIVGRRNLLTRGFMWITRGLGSDDT